MRVKRHSEHEIIGLLRKLAISELSVESFCRSKNISGRNSIARTRSMAGGQKAKLRDRRDQGPITDDHKPCVGMGP